MAWPLACIQPSIHSIGQGNEAQLAALRSLSDRFVGRDIAGVIEDLRATWRELVHDSQLRRLGPEKGVTHMAIGVLANASWTCAAGRTGSRSEGRWPS